MREEGAGTVLAVAIAGALVAAFLLVAPLAVVLEARHRAEAAADSAALAGADVALGVATGIPCDRARRVALAAGAGAATCAQRGVLVRVTTAIGVLGMRAGAEAVAGPPPASP